MKGLGLIALNSKIGMRVMFDRYAKHLSSLFGSVILGERSYQLIAGERFYFVRDAKDLQV